MTATMISRMIEENVTGTGSFVGSREDAVDWIVNAAVFNAEDITNWIVTPKFAFSNITDYHRHVLTVFMGPDEIPGIGLELSDDEQSMVKKISHSVTMVMERDHSCPYGFYLKTAYPNIHDKHAEIVDTITKEDIINDRLYKFDDKLSLAVFWFSDQGINFQYRIDDTHEPYLKIDDRQTNYTAFLRPTSVKYYKYYDTEDGKCQKLVRVHSDEVQANANEFSRTVSKMEDFLRKDNTISTKKEGEIPVDELIREKGESSLFKNVRKAVHRR